MPTPIDELVDELTRLKPGSPALHHFTQVAELAPVRVITREDRERVAFRRLTLAVAALIQRGERDDS